MPFTQAGGHRYRWRDRAGRGLEPRALQFVREWAGLHREEIDANWARARRSEPLLDIPPLP
jgi:hypothetical protein